MTYVFVAYEQLSDRDVNLAVFWDRDAASQFQLSVNNHVQAELVAVEPVALVDQYGFPCKISDLSIIAPWVSAA